jgi:hypothetical protein
MSGIILSEDFTYLSAIEASFRNRRFPVEIMHAVEYTSIILKHSR